MGKYEKHMHLLQNTLKCSIYLQIIQFLIILTNGGFITNAYLTLNHGNTMLLGNLTIIGFLDQIAENSQNDPSNFLLDAVAQNISQNRDDIELVHFLS